MKRMTAHNIAALYSQIGHAKTIPKCLVRIYRSRSKEKEFTRFMQGQPMAVCIWGFPDYKYGKAFDINIPYAIFFTTPCEHQYRKIGFY
jgi:hypothetical protein